MRSDKIPGVTDRPLEAATATWPEVAARVATGCIAILPFGAQEQHGHHLPLDTDTVMAEGLARRIATHFDSMVLPALGYGETWNNEAFPGTVSLSFDTVRAIALDIATSLQRDGVRALVVVNGDYGNQAPLRLAAREARDRIGFPVLIVDYPGLADIAAGICETPPSGPGFYHADELETSVVLALRPDLVRMELATPEYPAFPAVYGSTPVPLRDVSVSGVFGDPRRASAEKGERLLEALTERAVGIVGPFVDALAVGPTSTQSEPGVTPAPP